MCCPLDSLGAWIRNPYGCADREMVDAFVVSAQHFWPGNFVSESREEEILDSVVEVALRIPLYV